MDYQLSTQKKPTVFFASDHAGYELKNVLLAFVRDELGYEVEDCGAHELNSEDDYTDFVSIAAKHVSENPLQSRAIVLGGSGQGEAMCANRFPHVRAGVYYGNGGVQTDAKGEELTLLKSLRLHNDANVLSLGARFMREEEAKDAVRVFLSAEYKDEERHTRRIAKLG